MRNYVVKTSYSWIEAEVHTKFEAENKWAAFNHVIDIATEEAKSSRKDSDFDIYIRPSENKVIVRYGYDDEECYYEFEEECI